LRGEETMWRKIDVRNLFLAVLIGIGMTATAYAADPSGISNFREYSPTFSSSGQPTAKQLETVKESDFERIIYLAYTNQPTSLENEDFLVKELGMEYVHIPVEFGAPTLSDFYTFAAVMQQQVEKKTLLHCQVNFRASAFSLLYRVIYQDVAIEDAKEDMNSVWAPNEVWRDFIFEVLQANGKSPFCDVCDWNIAEGN
jgi:protein tyrosine phosphatase (PTP) superfamily phosphohydrolase (DUF442 family)